jgi:hypothetical protein
MVKYCECGCGGTTKSRFVPGHDAKMKSRLLQAMRAGDESAMDELINRGWMKVTGVNEPGFHYQPGIQLPPEESNPDRLFENEMMDKVGKIMALAMNAGTEEEAQAAAAMAQKLAFKYNLDLDQIARGNASPTRSLKHIIKGRVDIGAHKGWVETLMSVVARHNFCRIVFHTGTNEISIIGERHNILVVDYMFQFLRRTIDQLADTAWQKAKDWAYETALKWKDGYREGAVTGVHAKLETQRRDDVAENVGGSALVIRKEQEAEDAMNQMFPNLNYGRSRKVNYGGGYAQGQRDGANITINRGVGGSATRQTIGSGR